NESYDTDVEEDRVWYKEKVVYRGELPRGKYNKPWIGNITALFRLPADLSLTTVARYRGPYTLLENTGKTKEVPDGQAAINPLTGKPVSEELPIYDERDRDASVVVDCTLRWKIPLWGTTLTTTLEVKNLFNEKVLSSKKTYEVGRQFWVGGELRF
ncbi:MAG: TonB-dependent receptor, partial [Desulfobacterales bacterium]|nr:TonB-dependent receptor [Desulfobacterales bacterium]